MEPRITAAQRLITQAFSLPELQVLILNSSFRIAFQEMETVNDAEKVIEEGVSILGSARRKDMQ